MVSVDIRVLQYLTWVILSFSRDRSVGTPQNTPDLTVSLNSNSNSNFYLKSI